MPIEFRLPHYLVQDVVVTHAVPTRYRKLKLPIEDTAALFLSGKWGAMLKQHVQVADSFYCELYAEPATDMELLLSVTEPVIIMQTMMTGNIRVTYADSRMQLHPGKIGMQYLAPGVTYTISLTAGQHYRSVYFQAPAAMLEELSDTYPQITDMLQTVKTGSGFSTHLPYIRLSAAMRSEIEKMKNCPLTGQARTQYYNNRISDVVIAYLDSMHRITLQDSRLILLHEKEIDEFIERVDRCPEEHVNVEQRAHALGLTERALENAFKLKLGSTVKIYILQQRVEKAKQLLLATMHTITDIAMEVGYSDPSYFIRIFKQTEGVTPGRYRSDHSAAI
ncbi:helix-turn-helix transcriptional regulator [Chitinophaga sp. CF418]|uniref:helix-turn-helix transcriptional regulator n=1 Tax=Chitinophaga sp. CF418 TaxID=1855287 RepID=UPI000918D176|nr:helix-turn-helix transcriptional regulator [Chitinophaga sp. CF418]SHM93599.1 AraC-type DNA-binding protein [Chitinophaga sp. CF418]